MAPAGRQGAATRAQLRSCQKSQGGGSRVLLGHPTGAVLPHSPKVPAARPQHRHQMEENRRPESRTSSQKGEKSGDITSQEGELGGKKSVNTGEGNEKGELH